MRELHARPRDVAGAFAVFVLTAVPAEATFIQAPAIGARDAAMTGAVVASPADAGSLLLHNPAGVVDLEGPQATAGLFTQYSSGEYSNPRTGFGEKSAETPLVPTLWLGGFDVGGWRLGAGVYGAVGSSFSFDGDEAAGFPNRFLSQLTVAQVGLVAGREILPGLRLAIQLAPNYGEIRIRTPTPLGAVAFDVDGFGIGGTAGLLWDVLPGTTLGVGYRSPAVVYMSGDGEVAGRLEEVEIDFHVPQQVSFGFSHDLLDGLTFNAQARWTDYSQFEEGVFEFERTPMLDRPFIASARDTFRVSASLEGRPTDWARLRVGVSREPWMMEEESLTPLLYDNSDILFSGGTGMDFGAWTVDMMVGYSLIEDRFATRDRNPQFPGRYQYEGGVVGFLVTYRFGEDG